MNRKVTERDFRKEEFMNADPDDYEFRDDGKIVRKDRWETGIRRIVARVGILREWEISDVVDKVTEIKKNSDRYLHMRDVIGVRLEDIISNPEGDNLDDQVDHQIKLIQEASDND